jgi:hypothetical protein
MQRGAARRPKGLVDRGADQRVRERDRHAQTTGRVLEQPRGDRLLQGGQRIAQGGQPGSQLQRSGHAEHRGRGDQVGGLGGAAGKAGDDQQRERPRGGQRPGRLAQDSCGDFFQQRAGVQRVALRVGVQPA